MTLILFILILIGLILVHEFGHFSIAKLFGIRVDEFGIFFPPRIAAVRKGETEYSINWLPFGGFVKIFGENYNEGEADARSFVNKNRFIQAAVLVAGIIFNILTAWLVLSAAYMVGMPASSHEKTLGIPSEIHATVVAVVANSPASKAGLMPGDTILKVESGSGSLDLATLNTIEQAMTVKNFIADHQNESLIFEISRGGEILHPLAKPAEGIAADHKAVGIQMDDIGTLRLPIHLALAQGALTSWDMVKSTALGLAHFFGQIGRGTADFSQVAGPIGITTIGASALKEGFAAGAVLTALISINLALLNLLPIPGLDGGRLLVVIIEGITRKKVPVQVVNSITLVGLGLLILLMLIVSYHDIARLVG